MRALKDDKKYTSTKNHINKNRIQLSHYVPVRDESVLCASIIEARE